MVRDLQSGVLLLNRVPRRAETLKHEMKEGGFAERRVR